MRRREEDDRHRHHQEGEDEASSRAACGHSPKTWLPAFTQAGELTDSSVSEANSSSACARKNWNGNAGTQHNSEEALA